MYHTRPLGARQAGYDQIPAFIQQREDLTSGAKRLYGLLQSVQRMKAEPDYDWLAVELAASARSIVRWVAQLVAAGLIAVRRRGQGLPNLFTVLALVTSGPDTTSAPKVTDWQIPTRARHSGPKETPKNWNENRNRSARIDPSIPADPAAYWTGRLGGHIHV